MSDRTITTVDGGDLEIRWPATRKSPGDTGTVERAGRRIGHLIHTGRTSLDGSGISFGQCEAHYDGNRYGVVLAHQKWAKQCERNACRQFDSDTSAALFLDRIDRGEVC